ncbi:MAG: MerR family transcriptional regulator, partial [Usitatibacter sp.]
MHPYGVRDVERLLRLPRSTIRTLIAAGFVKPERGPRNAWRFSFQDLIVLRTAQALADARVPHRRITRSVKELRRHLPESMPLSGLSICAVADRVVVREGDSRWQADSGQYLLAFEGDPSNGSL